MRHLHKDDRRLWAFLELCARHVAGAGYVPPVRRLTVLSPRAKHYGFCDAERNVQIRLRNLQGRRLHAYQIIDTLSHELAHLKHLNHGERWFRLHAEILNYLKRGAYAEIRSLCKDRS